MSSQSRASWRRVLIIRSQCALAFGHRNGVRATLAPSARSTSSNSSTNLESRSWMASWIWSLKLVQLPGQVPGLLSDPGGIGMGGAVGVENAAAADLQADEHVESPKQHRVDGEEVAG